MVISRTVCWEVSHSLHLDTCEATLSLPPLIASWEAEANVTTHIRGQLVVLF